MDWADYSLKIAPSFVALVVAIGSIFWGRVVVRAKDGLLKAKDEQLNTAKESTAEVVKAKDAQIELLEHFRPARLLEDLDGLHEWYARREKVIQQQADEKVAEIKNSKTDDKEKKSLETQMTKLRDELSAAQRAREAAEQLAASLRSGLIHSTGVLITSGTVNAGDMGRPAGGLYDMGVIGRSSSSSLESLIGVLNSNLKGPVTITNEPVIVPTPRVTITSNPVTLGDAAKPYTEAPVPPAPKVKPKPN